MRTPLLAVSMLFAIAASATNRLDTPIARDVVTRLKDLDVETSTPARERRARTYLRSEVGVRQPSRVSDWASLHGDERETLAVREAIDEEVRTLVRGLWRTGTARDDVSTHAQAELDRVTQILFGDGAADADVRAAFGRRLREVAIAYPAPASRAEALAHVARLADALERTVQRTRRMREAGRGELTDDVSRDMVRTAVKLITEAYLVSAAHEPTRGAWARLRSIRNRLRRVYEPTIEARFWDEVRVQQLSDLPRYANSDFEIYDGVAEISAYQVRMLESLVGPRTLAETCAGLLSP